MTEEKKAILETAQMTEKEAILETAHALITSFVWSRTPQGGAYWKGVYNSLVSLAGAEERVL